VSPHSHNTTTYYAQYTPELLETNCAKEIWALYENGEFTPEVELTASVKRAKRLPTWMW
jgi:RIO kinase 1